MLISNILIFCLGLIIGSFINVLIYRLPKNQNFVTGRSHCPHCLTVLKWYDLIPLASFLILGRKCRYCRKKISWQYFWVELASGTIFLLAFIRLAGAGADLWLMSLFLLLVFLILFVMDLKYLILPDKIIITAVCVVLIFGLLEKFGILAESFGFLSGGNILAALALSLFLFFFWFVSKGKWIGLGDSKLAVLIGLVFGPIGGLAVIYLAVVLGALTGLILLATHKASLKTKLPLGSFICLAAALFVFAGDAIIKAVGQLGIFPNIFMF